MQIMHQIFMEVENASNDFYSASKISPLVKMPLIVQWDLG